MYHVFRYDDAGRVLADHETFSSDRGRLMPGGGPDAPGNLTMMDPPEHRRLRQQVSEAFASRAASHLEARIASVAEDLLNGIDEPEWDLVGRFAHPLPVVVMAELLGVDVADRGLFRSWADGLTSLQVDDMSSLEIAGAVRGAMHEMHEYMLVQCQLRRSSRRDDLLGRLCRSQVTGTGLEDDTVAGVAGLLLMAGHITTTLLLSNAVLCLDENPAAAAALRRDRRLIAFALEEVLRTRSPFMQTGRVTTRSVTIGACTIPANSFVTAWLLSANHDETQFADPERFDVRRRPNPHLGFGHGIHFCIGARLARLEARIALGLLLERFPGIRLAEDSDLPYYDPPIYGVRRLPVVTTNP
jgi:cytochrome P450